MPVGLVEHAVVVVAAQVVGGEAVATGQPRVAHLGRVEHADHHAVPRLAGRRAEWWQRSAGRLHRPARSSHVHRLRHEHVVRADPQAQPGQVGGGGGHVVVTVEGQSDHSSRGGALERRGPPLGEVALDHFGVDPVDEEVAGPMQVLATFVADRGDIGPPEDGSAARGRDLHGGYRSVGTSPL